MEYDYAKEQELPVLAFLHKNPENLPNKHVEKSNPDKLEEFRKKIETLHNRRTWSTKHDLATEVLASISQAVNLRPRVGWVRGEFADENSALAKKLEDLRVEYEAIRAERDSLAKRIGELEVDNRKQLIAWGDDEVEIAIQVKERGTEGTMVEIPFTTQWNRIFDLVAPELIGWSSTYNATRGVVSMLEDEVWRQESEADQLVFHGITEDSLDTIRHQLLALELILVQKERMSAEVGESRFSSVVERWCLSERGLREHSLKHARRRET